MSEAGTGQALKQFVQQVGALRLALIALALVTVAFAADPDVEPVKEGWRIVTTLVIPALSPMVLMVLLFDMLMAAVLMSDVEPPAKARYRLVLKVDGLAVLALLLSWLPFFLSLRG